MTLSFEARRTIRLALDERRRLELAKVCARDSNKVLCSASALNGRPCRNFPGPSGFCGVHARSHGGLG